MFQRLAGATMPEMVTGDSAPSSKLTEDAVQTAITDDFVDVTVRVDATFGRRWRKRGQLLEDACVSENHRRGAGVDNEQVAVVGAWGRTRRLVATYCGENCLTVVITAGKMSKIGAQPTATAWKVSGHIYFSDARGWP
jgi:hypothetical protein